MDFSSRDCIDVGTENCPCFLAATGDCLVCSRLQGKEACDCSWKGVCIYNEFVHGGRRVNNPRQDFEAPIVEKKVYMEDLVVFVLDVGKGFALKADRPGAYLFVRAPGMERFYDLPVSVLWSDLEKGQIHIAVKIFSGKSKVLRDTKEKMLLRGVYRNGVLGVKAFLRREIPGGKVLLLSRGIGAAPALHTAEFLSGRCQVDMIMDTGKITESLIADYDMSESGFRKYLSFADPVDQEDIRRLLKTGGYGSVGVFASDYYIQTLGRVVREVLPKAELAVSNNFRLCCGEGICGSCSFSDPQGNTLRMCKCQTLPDI